MLVTRSNIDCERDGESGDVEFPLSTSLVSVIKLKVLCGKFVAMGHTCSHTQAV